MSAYGKRARGGILSMLRIALIAVFALVGCRAPDPPSLPVPTLRVMTFNVAHGGGAVGAQAGLSAEAYQSNIDAVAAVVRREQPDVLAIQEVDAPSLWTGSFDHARRLADKAELSEVFHGVHFDVGLGKFRIAYGTALLSRRPLLATASYRSNVAQLHTKGFVTAEVVFDGRPVVVTSIHLDSGSSEVRRREVEQIIDVLRKADRPIILMGDLNSRWGREGDAVAILAARLNLDAYHPEQTDLDTFSTANPHARIDWILISRSLEFTAYRVVPDAVSDHLAVVAEVRRRP